MKRGFLYLLAGALLIGIALNLRWVFYVSHLVRHQAGVIFLKETISDRLRRTDLPTAERQQLELTLRIRAFVEASYGLTNSKSYLSFYNLDRPALGYNITVAPALSLKPETFNFFPIGGFDYLGFFDRKMAEAWASGYRSKGYDVHLAEIGGYSTLGWFEDPLYSSQLTWGEYGLARLLGHEIAHERLYVKNDTTFSELLASFIEKKIAGDYMRSAVKIFPSEKEMSRKRAKSVEFLSQVMKLKDTLELLYESPRPAAEKLAQKSILIADFKARLKQQAADLKDIPLAKELSELAEINNATLVQFHRYSPQGKAFENLYESCKSANAVSAYPCWFENLRKLEICSTEERKRWLAGEGEILAATCVAAR